MPSNARFMVLFWAITLSVITYIDRVCISNTSGDIKAALNLSNEDFGKVLAAFAAGYALLEIPMGWWGDKKGPRVVLMRVVIMWSVFTALTGYAWSLLSLIVIRFFFGAGEAGCFPNLTKAFTNWLPKPERVRAQGILWMSARWGGAFTPFVVAAVLKVLDWRNAFVLFGGIGIIWAFFFFRWFRDTPEEHSAVNAAELKLIQESRGAITDEHEEAPWGAFFSSLSVILLWVQYFFMSYSWYFFITWLPTWLKDQKGIDFKKDPVLAGLPLFLGGVACFVAGWLLPRLGKQLGSDAKARRLLGFVGMASACGFMLLVPRIESAVPAVIALAMASFCNDLAMPSSWAACMDVGGRYAGTLSGAMNMMGNFGGVLAPWLNGWILDTTNNNWAIVFTIPAIFYLCAAICWLFIDPVTPVRARRQPA
jgi:MFS transporter, ACS family, glucarate transporter